jgi:dolichol-phosphate mannosyltransferase
MNCELSIISPCYGAPTLLKELVRQTTEVAKSITEYYEIILVEDCSPDNSREIIREICKENPNVKGVFLSRNFGQQPAINAGLDTACGEWVAVLDCDLQNPPSHIRAMYEKAQEGYDIVFASRQDRPDNLFMKQGSKIFNNLMTFLTGVKQDESIAEFALYNHKVVEAMKKMGDYVRYYPLMHQWVGFKTTSIPVPHEERNDGKVSSYSMRKRIELAVSTSIAFSTKALHMIVYFGISITLLAIIVASYLAIKFLITGIDVSGWFTLFVSMWLIAGIMIMVMGIVAIYIGNIFMEVKHRPTYLIDEIVE